MFECTLEGEPPVWVCYGNFSHACTATLKSGRKPSVRLSYNASSTSKLEPEFMLGNPLKASASIVYSWRLRSIHSLAPPDLDISVAIDFALRVSVKLPNPKMPHRATAKIFIQDRLGELYRKSLTVSSDDPVDKYYSKSYYVTAQMGDYDPYDIFIEADLYISPYGLPDNSPCCKASAIIDADPTITIDPDFMVNIDGVDYPANQLYEVVLSENLLVPIQPLSTPWIPLLLLED